MNFSKLLFFVQIKNF